MSVVYLKSVQHISEKCSMYIFKLFKLYHKNVKYVFSNCSAYITKKVQWVFEKCSLYITKMFNVYQKMFNGQFFIFGSVSTYSSPVVTQRFNCNDAAAPVVRNANSLSLDWEYDSYVQHSFLGFLALARCNAKKRAGPFNRALRECSYS